MLDGTIYGPYDSVEDAFEALYETLGDPYIDNDRVAWLSDLNLEEYRQAVENGCCGSEDRLVLAPRRPGGSYQVAMIGCNYGH